MRNFSSSFSCSLLRGLFFLLATFCASQSIFAEPKKSPEAELRALLVKYAGAKVAVEENEMEWSYPYFVGTRTQRLNRFNSWLRTQSIERLFPLGEDEQLVERALKNKDSTIIEWIKSDEKIRSALAESTGIEPLRTFGKLIFLSAGNTFTGVRYYINSEILVYDFEAGSAIPLQSLFKDGAEQELNELLVKSITTRLSATRREYKKCLRRKVVQRDLECGGDDVDYCLNNTHIDWSNLDIINSRHLRLEFPYRPGTHAACGYEFGFDLKGSEVEKLFVTPTIFRKSHDVRKAD